MENSVSLILCVSGSCGFSETVFKNTLLLAGVDFQLLVYSRTPSIQLRHLFEKASDVFVDGSDFENAPQALNYLLTRVTGTRVVILPYETICPEGWLPNFISYFDSFEQVGTLTLPYKADTLETKSTQVIDKNYDIQTLYCSDNSDHFGVTVFQKEIMLLTGAFDETLPLKLSFQQYLYRIAMTGLKNYCVLNIPTTSLISVATQQTEQELYLQTLQSLKSGQNPFVQLHNLTDLEEIAFHDLDNLIFKLNNGSKKFCSKYIRHFGIICPALTESHLKEIKKYARKYSFNFKIEPYREVSSGFEGAYLTVIF